MDSPRTCAVLLCHPVNSKERMLYNCVPGYVRCEMSEWRVVVVVMINDDDDELMTDENENDDERVKCMT